MKVFRDLSWFFKQEKKAYLTGIFMLFLVIGEFIFLEHR